MRALSGEQRAAWDRRTAFTLIELIVVMVIIVVVAGAIVPRMGRSIWRQQLVEGAARFALTCRTAREVAAASGRACTIEIDLDGGTYFATEQSASGEGNTVERSRATWLRQGRLPEGIKLVSAKRVDGVDVSSGTVSLQFFPDGRSSGAVVRLAGDEAAYEVIVQQETGRVVYGPAGEVMAGSGMYDLGDGE